MAPLPAGLWTTKSLTLDRMSAQRDEKVSGSSKVVTRGIWSDIEPLPTWNTLAGFFQRLELLPNPWTTRAGLFQRVAIREVRVPLID